MAFFASHEIRKLLRRYGIEVEELKNISRVEVYTTDNKKLVLQEPQVLVFKIGGQLVYQIACEKVVEVPVAMEGKVEEKVEVSISEDDVRFVAEHTGVTYEEARAALIKAGGDIAKAIMLIAEGKHK